MKLLKEALKRGLIGILSGLFLHSTILLLSSLGKETLTLSASGLQEYYMIYALGGFYFAGISVLFEVEEWSLLRQFITHVIATLPFLPIAYAIGLMPHTGLGITAFIGFYLSGYVVSFIIYLIHLKKQAQDINKAL